MGKFPDFSYEKKLWKKSFRHVAGCDEVGRGCFAGPVVAGCVIFSKSVKKGLAVKINDSKKMTANQREKASYWIKRNASGYGIGKASVSEINKHGIKKASETAFRRAIKNTNKRVDFLLIDAFYLPYVKNLKRKNQLAIVRGDGASFSIASASIIAKVYRDKLMQRLGEAAGFKRFGWGRNKGYGTRKHQRAILNYGITRHHRKQFVETFITVSRKPHA